MVEVTQKLNLGQTVTYQIKVPGQINNSWAEWSKGITITVENNDDDQPISTLIGTFDQAALQGLLRRLYSSGIPLISVILVEVE